MKDIYQILKDLELSRDDFKKFLDWCGNKLTKELVSWRNQPALYRRNCIKCGKEIETSYAPNRPENVYCEACYTAEVS